MADEASATDAGKIELKTRKIESRTGQRIPLFFTVTSYYPSRLFSSSLIITEITSGNRTILRVAQNSLVDYKACLSI
jgi:hypothetical protein